jgi:hypothetical protein
MTGRGSHDRPHCLGPQAQPVQRPLGRLPILCRQLLRGQEALRHLPHGIQAHKFDDLSERHRQFRLFDDPALLRRLSLAARQAATVLYKLANRALHGHVKVPSWTT